MNWDYCLSHAPWPEAMLIVYGYRQYRNVASMVTHLFFSRAIFQETCPVLNVHVSCKN